MGTTPLRTHHAGDLTAADIGTEVRLAGWVNRRRDHGGVLFVDLRDASGVVQAVLNPDDAPAPDEVLAALRMEYCVTLAGTVRARPDGTVNPDMATGAIEVVASSLEVLSPSDPLPFQLDERSLIDESRRLEYRYLDLRRPRMAENLRARSRAIREMRRVLDDRDFLEIETPTLIRSTPEGARDVLVPSRLRQGYFYALPQSPQLFKQLLMVGGVERYYQIARCYRDEDFRADRQLEFTQLDIEGSFWGQDDVLATLEAVMVAVVREARGINLATPFPRLSYDAALARFGTDKPDTRFGMEIVDLSVRFGQSEFGIFADTVAGGGVIRGINAGDQGLSRSGFDALVEQAKGLGARGLIWAAVTDEGALRSPIAKFLTEAEQAGLIGALEGAPGDAMLIVADSERTASTVLGQLRLELGKPADQDDLAFLWVVDFPVFEETAEGDLAPAHHPFTAPVDVAEMRDHPRTAVSKAYDLVLNGAELGSGSVRIHDPDVQRQVFEILGISGDDAERRFGWFMKALRYGTPPHAGFAVGIDRLVSILRNEPNIREIIPFPKTQTGLDPMTGSPTLVDDYQLIELGIDLRPAVRSEILAAAEEADRDA
jgi:aspartyl-tRNA synthetase